MNLADRVRGWFVPAQPVPEVRPPFPPHHRPPGPPPTGSPPTGGVPVDLGAVWLPPGVVTSVAGYPIHGGLVYVGHGLRAGRSGVRSMVEPALLDPGLPVDRRRPDWAGQGLDYWPAYDSIPAATRAAYLTWLADGRRRPDVPIGYVFLFFYGLERFALLDSARDPRLRGFLPAVAAEVRRLLSIYGRHRSFASYAGRFLELLDLMVGPPRGDPAPPARAGERAAEPGTVPSALRLGLARFAVDRRPVPADWALAWAWHHPELHPRTAQTRCATEFDRLFRLRYGQRHGRGITVPPGRRRITGHYQPASAGIEAAEFAVSELPDVVESPGPSRLLADLVTDVTNELDPYSRWLGRNPDGRGSTAGAALLPPELVDGTAGEVGALRRWAEDRLGGKASAVLDGAELLARWPTEAADRMTRAEAVACAQLLGNLGFGVEPDVRLGGPAIAGGPMVLFRDPSPSTVATPAYAAATMLLHLAVAVSAADGEVSEAERRLLREHLEAALYLTGPERLRLGAHVRRLTATEVTLTGLKKRLDGLDRPQRGAIADFLVAVAAADGVISPAEVRTVTRIHTLLDVPATDLHDRLHRRLTTRRTPPATDPVTVRPRGTGPAGYAIPAADAEPGPGVLVLDENVIAEKLAQTAQVSALLASIFTDDFTDDEDPAPVPAPAAPTEPPVAGLDAAHGGLLRALVGRPSWSQGEFHELARRFGVLPAGAVDVLNEAAVDLCGEPVVEGEDEGENTVRINDYAVQELLG